MITTSVDSRLTPGNVLLSVRPKNRRRDPLVTLTNCYTHNSFIRLPSVQGVTVFSLDVHTFSTVSLKMLKPNLDLHNFI